MKHTRVTLRFDAESAPELFVRLGDPSAIEEVRLVDWNRAASEVSTFLYAIEGDADGFAEAAEATKAVESVRLVSAEETVSYAFLTAREHLIPVIEEAVEAIARAGLIVRRPIVWRDDRSHCHVVGDPTALQGALEALPEEIDCRIDEIGQFPCGRTNPASALSDRQREAVAVALDLGYYEHPREATQEDIAAELGCATNTASEHLQKAEAKLVRAGMGRVDPGGKYDDGDGPKPSRW
ncbi:helix-turn-helix domain-containing protein [Halorhabdus amylolytica]|uniref:helix-turn-helix domain-containing protein n=1 Tax=Halorhabdus amylolytica TaxID=2559573 RepID=UPI0010AB0B41|nr:helix-turn-helix domain-containing protein [Halorhabdus amylolytica]